MLHHQSHKQPLSCRVICHICKQYVTIHHKLDINIVIVSCFYHNSNDIPLYSFNTYNAHLTKSAFNSIKPGLQFIEDRILMHGTRHSIRSHSLVLSVEIHCIISYNLHIVRAHRKKYF